MTSDEFQKKYHDFKTPDREAARMHASIANMQLTDDQACVVNFDGTYGLMLKSSAEFLTGIGLVEREPKT